MKNKIKTIGQKWTTPAVDGRGLIGGFALLLLSFLVAVYQFPESWRLVVYDGSLLLYLLTASTWASISANEKWTFWMFFCLGLIPYVRLVVFLCITVYTIGILLWDKMREA